MEIVNLAKLLRHHRWEAGTLNRLFGAGRWRYVGWGNRRLGLGTSPLANPYTCKRHSRRTRVYVPSRTRAVDCYRRWLWDRIQAKDEAVLAELSLIGPETTLLCWCAPKRCHSEVIRDASAWLRGQENVSACGDGSCDGTCSLCEWIQWEDRKAAEGLTGLLHPPYQPYS